MCLGGLLSIHSKSAALADGLREKLSERLLIPRLDVSSREIKPDYLFIIISFFSHHFRAPLAHAHAVAPALARELVRVAPPHDAVDVRALDLRRVDEHPEFRCRPKISRLPESQTGNT